MGINARMRLTGVLLPAVVVTSRESASTRMWMNKTETESAPKAVTLCIDGICSHRRRPLSRSTMLHCALCLHCHEVHTLRLGSGGGCPSTSVGRCFAGCTGLHFIES